MQVQKIAKTVFVVLIDSKHPVKYLHELMNQQYVCKIKAENLYPKKSKERKTLTRFYLVADESHPSIM